MDVLRKIKYLILPALFAVFISFSGQVILSGIETAPVHQASMLRITSPEEGPVLFFGHSDGRVPVASCHSLPLFEEGPSCCVADNPGRKMASCHAFIRGNGESGFSILLYICKMQV